MHLQDEVYYILIPYEKEFTKAILICIRNNKGGRQNISHGRLISLCDGTVVGLFIMCPIDMKLSHHAFRG